LSYDFEDDDLSDFINPTGVDLCGTPLPSGVAAAMDGEVLLTNDPGFGISILGLRPAVVQANFPASRNYILRVRVNLESVNELLVYLRGRVGVSPDGTQVNSRLERGYAFVLGPQFLDPEFTDGVLASAEFTACHDLIEHPEWPGGTMGGFGRVPTPSPVIPGDWYWLELSVQGTDNGGPVRLTGKTWLDGDDEPDEPQLVVVDANGLPHTPDTLSPAADVQVFFGTSFDFGQQPGATARIDDFSLTELLGCEDAPARVRRTLWDERVLAEGAQVAVFAEGPRYPVSLAISDLRPQGICTAAGRVRVTERVPDGLAPSMVSAPGQVQGNTIVWDLDLTGQGGGGGVAPLTYEVAVAPGAMFQGPVVFTGELTEPGSDFNFLVAGDAVAASDQAVAPISDFGSIQHWLILGSFTRQVPGANPGEAEIVRDYLTDGDTTEAEIQPEAGDTIEPNYNGLAASTGLAANALGRNPNDVPTWVEWRDYDDLDDRVDFESVYGDLNDVMCYGLTYIRALEDVVVNFAVSSDDSVHVLLDGVTLHANAVPRGALARNYQDTCFTHMSLCQVELAEGIHTLVIKVFEGGGEHNFRVGFLDDAGVPIAGGPPEIEICLEPDCGKKVPPEAFRRGDVDTNRVLEITDAISLLNFLFLGTGAAPVCPDSADGDDNGTLELTDAIRVLQFLFLGGAEPPAPGSFACGPDPTPDELGPCGYDPARC
jgi:hypothetical protein